MPDPALAHETGPETSDATVISFTVAVATLRRPDRLADCLSALLALRPAPDEIIVVDGDEERSAETVVRQVAAGADLPVRYLTGPLGLTRQRNVALDAARGDVVVFVDDDALLEPNALAELRAGYEDDDVVGATGRVDEVSSHRIGGQRSRLRRLLAGGRAEGSFSRCGYPHRIVHTDQPGHVETMSGCFMSARTGLARRLRFDEALAGYALAEDEDFSYRLSRHGRIAYVPTAVVHHDNSGFGDRDRVRFNRHVVVNRRYLFRKNFPRTFLAEVEFAGLVVLLMLHRVMNADLSGLRGLWLGVLDLLRGRDPG